MKTFIKYIFPALYGLIVYFTIRILLDSVTGMIFWHRSWILNGIELTASVIMGYIFVYALKRLFRYFDSWGNNRLSYNRVVKELWYVFLLNLILQNLFLTPIAALTDDGLQWYDVADINIIPLLYAIIYYGIARSRTFLKAYIDNKIQLEKISNDKLQTELKFLKAQYHPHFLFNALNAIYFQMDDDVVAAKKSVEKFAELLRYQLYDQEQQVSVSQEIEYLKNFIDLQKVRASEKLKMDIMLDENLNGQKVYPLLFLPLVENAFKYIGGKYELMIYAHAFGNSIDFLVENSIQPVYKPAKVKGIGLENLRRRLDLLYPGRHEFTIEKEDAKFIARIKIQLQDDEK
ncbi:MAG TPA: sensor histidine kinase [Puia sp.]|nr:sensor histidine kinase [Puia sp.]